MKLNIFNTANLFEAATNLFQQLGIKLNSNTAEPLPVKDLLKQHYKDNDTFKTIGKTCFYKQVSGNGRTTHINKN